MRLTKGKSIYKLKDPIGLLHSVCFVRKSDMRRHAVCHLNINDMMKIMADKGEGYRDIPYYVSFYGNKVFIYPPTAIAGELEISYYPVVRIQ